MKVPPTPVELLGLHVHPLRRPKLLELLTSWAASPEQQRMYYTNAHVFNLARDHPTFRDSLNDADLLICEGIGGRIGGMLAGVHLPEQLATMDWIDDFLEELRILGRSVYLLGDEPGVAHDAARRMLGTHPGLDVAGSMHGFFPKDMEGNARATADINATGADVLFVGMGSPLQELWIDEHRHQLDVDLVLALGAMFRWYSGIEPRAPGWMRRLGLEWLLRLVRHPVRHFRRYVIGNPRFLYRCLMQRFETPRDGR